jgi:hypothetical protein
LTLDILFKIQDTYKMIEDFRLKIEYLRFAFGGSI